MLIDTNVISEMLRLSPEPAVETWYRKKQGSGLYLSTISEAELRLGAAIMPPGKRQKALASAIDAILQDDFKERILSFDSAAAREFAAIEALRRSIGRRTKPADSQIAAIARSRNMTLATRNVKDFKDTGLEVINPWEEE